MSQVKVADRRQSRAAWGVMGFFLALALGVASWFLAPPLTDVLPRNLQNLLEQRFPEPAGQIIVAAVIFVILLSFVGVIVAIFAPKPRATVKDSDILKERQAVNRDKQARERLARNIAIENRKTLREQANRDKK
jgi:cbb3-type cytochrome oxidase subunit 3